MLRACVVCFLVAVATLCHAQFAVIPKGQEGGTVTPKRARGEMHCYDAFATLTLEVTFATDPDWGGEVDFLVRLPANVDATGFAYWFQDEKVVARTVEKERAAAIYDRITSFRRDPALIEYVGRRQFRVRIAPVDASKDLRIEMKFVVTPTKGALELPLQELLPGRLESAEFTVHTHGDSPWKNNWGVPATRATNGESYRFASNPWRATSNWRFSAQSKPYTVSAGRPSKGDGTILVAFTAPRDMRNVRLSFPSKRLHSVYPSTVSRLRRGETVTFTGRVSSACPEFIELSVGETKWAQKLPRTPLADRAAVVVWGARHVTRIKDRSQILYWGMTLGIPTKETSWLAVPKAEWATFLYTKLELDSAQYWETFDKRGPDAKETQAILTRLKKNAAEWASIGGNGNVPDNTLRDLLEQNRAWATSNKVGEYVDLIIKRGKSHPSAKKARERLALYERPLPGVEFREPSLEPEIQSDVLSKLEDRLATLNPTKTQRWDPQTQTYTALKSISNKAVKRLRGEITHLLGSAEPLLPTDTRNFYYVSGGLTASLYRERNKSPYTSKSFDPYIAESIRVANHLNVQARLMAAARRQVTDTEFFDLKIRWQTDREVSSISNGVLAKRMKEFEALTASFGGTRDEVVENALWLLEAATPNPQEPPDPRRVNEVLTPEQILWSNTYGIDLGRSRKHLYESTFSLLGEKWSDLKGQTIRDPEVLADAESLVKAWAKTLGEPGPEMGQPFSLWGYSARDQYVENLRRKGPRHPDTIEAKRVMEARDAQRRSPRTNFLKYRADLIQTEIELDNLSWRTLTPAEQKQRTYLESRQKYLRVRMGDPLITVVAPLTAKVTARLPDGRFVNLRWNAQSARWEYRFDMPPGSKDGIVEIPIWVVLATGTIREDVVKVVVDQASGDLRVTWTKTPEGWRAWVETEADVVRVNVSLADGRRFALSKVSHVENKIRWQATLTGDLTGEAIVVATDAAHNRKEVRHCFSP